MSLWGKFTYNFLFSTHVLRIRLLVCFIYSRHFWVMTYSVSLVIPPRGLIGGSSPHSHTKFQATSSFKFWHTSRTYACNFIFWPETLLSFLSSKHRFNWITICIWWRDEKIGGIFFCCLLFCCCCLVGIAECHCIMSLRNLVGRIRRVIKESRKLYNYFIVEDCASCYVWLRF